MGYTDVTSDIVEQDSEIDLKEMFSLFISNVWIIIMGGVVFGFLAFLISEYAMTPIYESSTKYMLWIRKMILPYPILTYN